MAIRRSILAGALLMVVGPPAEADAPPSVDLAVGLKRGDGLGNSPGVDFFWSPHSKIALGIAGYYLPETEGRGLALAPSIQLRTSDARERLVPFLSLGVKHLQRNFGGRWGHGLGGFGAFGLQWRFASGLSLRGGFGFHGQAAVRAEGKPVTISQPGHAGFFVESGVRYWF